MSYWVLERKNVQEAAVIPMITTGRLSSSPWNDIIGFSKMTLFFILLWAIFMCLFLPVGSGLMAYLSLSYAVTVHNRESFVYLIFFLPASTYLALMFVKTLQTTVRLTIFMRRGLVG